MANCKLRAAQGTAAGRALGRTAAEYSELPAVLTNGSAGCADLSTTEAHTDLGASRGPASVRPGGWCHTAVSDVPNEQAVFPPGWLFDLEFAERKQQKSTVLH